MKVKLKEINYNIKKINTKNKKLKG